MIEKSAIGAAELRRLANIEIQAKRHSKAQQLLQRSIELEPAHLHTRYQYTVLLLRQQNIKDALIEVDLLLADRRDNPKFSFLKACILARAGNQTAAIKLFETLLKNNPNRPRTLLCYGHALKALGRVDDAIAAYRQTIAIGRHSGEAYWSLANLKTFKFSDLDVVAMSAAIDINNEATKEQSYLSFALAKALEDRKLYDDSFHHYQRGNGIRHAKNPTKWLSKDYQTGKQLQSYTTAFFAQRSGWGCPSADPIFIVGLPRAGSTLLEQILASHSAANGTGERPDIVAIDRNLQQQKGEAGEPPYTGCLAALSRQQCSDLGEAYLCSTQIQRGQSAFFVDKMPNNFMHIGLIHLILPNAKIIDMRRHPMASCFACYKQLFAKGQNFTYDLTAVGHYYRNYVKVMDHWSEALPGKVLPVQYEELVRNPLSQIRRLLNFCGLPFEQSCLRFYDTKRSIHTPSAQQVRQPIFSDGLEQWRHYEKHLEPLRRALGPLTLNNSRPYQAAL